MYWIFEEELLVSIENICHVLRLMLSICKPRGTNPAGRWQGVTRSVPMSLAASQGDRNLPRPHPPPELG